MFAGSSRTVSVRRVVVSTVLALVASLSIGVGSASAAAPSVPGNVSLSPGNGQLSVSFTASSVPSGSSAVAFYAVEYKLSSSGTWIVWSDSSTSTGYTINPATPLTNGSTYQVRIRSNNGAYSSYTATTSVIVGTPVAPQIAITHPAPLQAVVQVTTPVNNGSAITDYKVEYRLGTSGAFTNFNHTATTNTRFTIGSLNNIANYTFRVAAINGRGTSPYSEVVASVTCNSASAPGTPGLVLTAGNQEIVVTPSNVRDSNSCDPTDYEVRYGVAGSDSLTTWTHDASTPTPYTISGLAIGTLYAFEVKAINSAGSSAVAKTDSKRTFSLPAAPDINSFARGNGEATVTFTEGAGDADNGISDYLVEYKTSASETWLTWEHAQSDSELSYTITGLTNGVVYDVRVSAINAIGIGNPSQTSTTALFVMTYEVDGDYNDPSDTSDATVTGCNGACPSTLVIPASFDLHPVVAIAGYAFDGEDAITSVTIPEGVTTIGYKAFWGSSADTESIVTEGSLESVTLPSTLVTIGGYAFASQPNLTTLSLPNAVETVGPYAFRHNTGLVSISLGSGLTSLGRYAFNGCTSLFAIAIPNGVTTIEKATFFGASSLKYVTLPTGLTSVGRYAFSGTDIVTLSLPYNLTTIENSAFRGMPSLTQLTVGANVTSVGVFAFGDNPYATVQFQGNLPTTFATNAFSRKTSAPGAAQRTYDVPSTMTIQRGSNSTGWPANFGGRSVTTLGY